MDFKLKIRLCLENGDNKFMGVGVLWLLQKLKETESLRAAASDLGISYSKAYNMISNLELCLGKPVVSRSKGGNNRCGATLNSFGIEYLALYESFQNECNEKLKDPFDKFIENLDFIIDSQN